MVPEPHLICRRGFPPLGPRAARVIAATFNKESEGQRGYSITHGSPMAEPNSGPGTTDADSVNQCWGCPQLAAAPWPVLSKYQENGWNVAVGTKSPASGALGLLLWGEQAHT